MELINRLKGTSPQYLNAYKELIARFTLAQGGMAGTATEQERWSQGKYFSTQYEIYMYAAIMGLKRSYKIPLTSGVEKSKFIELRAWQPTDVADYLIMGVMAQSDIDFNALEDMEEKEIDGIVGKLRREIEEYANGGFDIINSKMTDDAAFFENNENCFLDLLQH